METRMPIFAERFLKLRGDMTQGQFAEFLSISRPTVGLYESGARIPDALGLRNIAEKCNVSADYLLGLDDCTTHDTQYIMERTGLSEHAINKLAHYIKKDEIRGLNFLIENPAFYFFLLDMCTALDCYNTESALIPPSYESIEKSVKTLEKAGFLTLDVAEAGSYYAQQAANRVIQAFEVSFLGEDEGAADAVNTKENHKGRA